MEISPAQCRAARAMVNWSLSELARRSGIDRQTINRFEQENRKTWPKTRARLRQVLEEVVEFGADGWIRLRP